MKTRSPLHAVAMIAACGLLGSLACQAAFVIEPNGKAVPNFSAANGTGTSTVANPDNDLALPQTLTAPGLTQGAASVFGGAPYTYTYEPSSDLDNTSFTVGTTLNGQAGWTATGNDAGGAGIYRVYHTFPTTTNATLQPTSYTILIDGSSVSLSLSQWDQNVVDASNGLGYGLWELIGVIAVPSADATIELILTPDEQEVGESAFVGVRTAGALFDYVGPIPEPSSAILAGLGAAFLLFRRRR